MFFNRRSLRETPALPSTAVWPDDPAFTTARQDDNARLDFSPAVIVYCASVEDVSRCVTWARANEKPIAIRSGGHDYEGFSLNNGGIVVDLSRYRGVYPSEDRATAWIRAGTDLRTMYHDLVSCRRTLPGGTCPTVAVGGLVTGGGYGMLVRRHGLLCDHLIRVRWVDGDGAARDSSTDPAGEDMLWACRGGGGGSFGIVTDFQFAVLEAPVFVTTFSVRWNWAMDTLLTVLPRWAKSIADSRDLTSVLTIAVPAKGIHAFGQFLGEPAELNDWLDALTAGTSPTERSVQQRRYIDAVDFFGGAPGTRQSWKMKSSLSSREIDGEAVIAIVAAVERPIHPNVTAVLEFDSLGGGLADRARKETAFPHRDALYSLQYQAYWSDSVLAPAAAEWINAAFGTIDPFTDRTSYRNYCDLDLIDWPRRYFGSNYERLRAIKSGVDPDNLFTFPQSIEPLEHRAALDRAAPDRDCLKFPP